ncbi:MAG: hypothetical protein H0X34_17165 [Chthoniobacterales bacterium]|nr:hypothetical protein [Chthoniobacterales bacterium]
MEGAAVIEADSVRSITIWRKNQSPSELQAGGKVSGTPWFDLPSGGDAERLMPQLAASCPGLTIEMLEDLLTPDDQPEGVTYANGQIKLASTFAVEARRLEGKRERGKAMRSGVLVFQPVELLASDHWLLTCWHPIRTFVGAEKISEGAAGSPEEISKEVCEEWISLDHPGGVNAG